MTDKLIAAAKQVLEALDNMPIEYDYNDNPMYVELDNKLGVATEALRQAIDNAERDYCGVQR